MSPALQRFKQRQALSVDADQNGLISEEEAVSANQLLEIELREEKAVAQKRMAWFATIITAVATLLLYTGWVDIERVQALSELLGLFFIAQAGIVGAYFGATAWMSKH